MATAAVSYNNAVLDAALNTIIDNAPTIILLPDTAEAYDAQDTAYATVSAASLGSASVTYGVSDPVDATSGRKTTVTPAQGTVTGAGSSTASAYALVNTTTSTVYAIGDLTDQTVTNGNNFTIAAFEITFADPTIPA
jgi:hypothetical protein